MAVSGTPAAYAGRTRSEPGPQPGVAGLPRGNRALPRRRFLVRAGLPGRGDGGHAGPAMRRAARPRRRRERPHHQRPVRGHRPAYRPSQRVDHGHRMDGVLSPRGTGRGRGVRRGHRRGRIDAVAIGRNPGHPDPCDRCGVRLLVRSGGDRPSRGDRRRQARPARAAQGARLCPWHGPCAEPPEAGWCARSLARRCRWRAGAGICCPITSRPCLAVWRARWGVPSARSRARIRQRCRPPGPPRPGAGPAPARDRLRPFRSPPPARIGPRLARRTAESQAEARCPYRITLLWPFWST